MCYINLPKITHGGTNPGVSVKATVERNQRTQREPISLTYWPQKYHKPTRKIYPDYKNEQPKHEPLSQLNSWSVKIFQEIWRSMTVKKHPPQCAKVLCTQHCKLWNEMYEEFGVHLHWSSITGFTAVHLRQWEYFTLQSFWQILICGSIKRPADNHRIFFQVLLTYCIWFS